jgi:hypothetical protein
MALESADVTSVRVPGAPAGQRPESKNDLPNGTLSVFEDSVSEAEPAASNARAAHTPPIDIIGERRSTL